MKQIKHAAAGAGISMLLYLALAALLAALIVRGTVGEGRTGILVLCFACAAAFAGAKLASSGQANPAAVCACSAALFWCAILLSGFLVNDTLAPGRAAYLATAIAAGGMLACLPRIGKEKRRKRKRRSHK